MKKTVKKILLVIPLSLVGAFLAVSIFYFISSAEKFTASAFFISFGVFFCVQFAIFRILDLVLPRINSEDDVKVRYGIAKSFNNEKQVSINDYLTLKFDLSETAVPFTQKIDDTNTFFAVCDVVGSSVATGIVEKILMTTFEISQNVTDLQKMMKSLDSSIKLLNMKGVTFSILVGIIDSKDMKLNFINASVYDVFTYQKNAKSILHIPLISNRYKMASDKQLPFLSAEYPLKVDDIIVVSYEESKCSE